MGFNIVGVEKSFNNDKQSCLGVLMSEQQKKHVVVIRARSNPDAFARFLGVAIDDVLKPCEWWETQKQYIVGTVYPGTENTFEFEVDPGKHRIEIAVSCPENFRWLIEVYYDNVLACRKGDVTCRNKLICFVSEELLKPKPRISLRDIALTVTGFGVGYAITYLFTKDVKLSIISGSAMGGLALAVSRLRR